MDFEDAKENIQPLASGRNASLLASSLISHADLQKQRDALEAEIKNYEGNDPLEPWYEYILWIEQSYPSGGNESGLKDALLKCLMAFEEDKRYYQDRRLIRIFIKYFDTEENPIELYQELFNYGIGTMIADLYICWAYYYDLVGNFKKADSIFRKGLELRAQPYDELEQAHKHFGFTMSQRILHQDETSKEEFLTSMKERRNALTSLRPHKKIVGSIRTGSAIKSSNPGKIKVDEERAKASTSQNIKVQVFKDENAHPNFPICPTAPEEHHIPVVRNIIDSARKQENLREPGPWTKGVKKKGHLFGSSQNHTHEMPFTILEDDSETDKQSSSDGFTKLPDCPNNYSKGILLPPNFARRNYPQGVWKVAMVADDEVKPQSFPQYNKLFHYPKPDVEFSLEEVLAYKWFKRNNKENNFMQYCRKYLDNEIDVGIRLYKNFSKKNLPDKNTFELSEFRHNLPENCKLVIDIKKVYVGIESSVIKEEKQFEEILFESIKSGRRKLKFDGNETIRIEEEMDQTTCFTDIVGRKSIFPSRKSMAPCALERKTLFKPSVFTLEEQEGAESICDKTEPVTDNIRYTTEESRKSVIAENLFLISAKRNEHQNSDENKNITAEAMAAKFSFPQITKKPSIFSNKGEEATGNTECGAVATLEKSVSGLLVNEPFNFSEIYEKDAATPSLMPEKLNIDALITEDIKNRQADIKVSTENKINNFAIYEDNDDDSFKFKQPHPIKTPLQVKKPFTIFEDDFKESPTAKTAPVYQEFAADETCSTQNFNLFIKAKSISTPISKPNPIVHQRTPCVVKKSVASLNFDNLVDNNEFNAVIQSTSTNTVSPSTAVDLTSSLTLKSNIEPTLILSPDCPEQPPFKQLSTIMETSEPNTLATGSTKSSAESNSSFTNDVESNFKQADKTRDKTGLESSRDNKSDINCKSLNYKSRETERSLFEIIKSKSGKNFKNSSLTDSNNFVTNLSTKPIPLEDPIEFNKSDINRQSVIKMGNSIVSANAEINKSNVIISLEKEQNLLPLKSYNFDISKLGNENITITDSTKSASKLLFTPKTDKPHTEIQTERVTDDTTHHLNMKSIQVFEDKTETVPKLLFKRKICVEEQQQDDLYNFFVKTPERKGPTIALAPSIPVSSKNGFEINDTITFSNLKEMTLPTLPDHSKVLMKDSPVAKLGKFSFIRDHSLKMHEESSFAEKRDIYTKFITSKNNIDEPTFSNLNNFTLPKLPEKLDNSSYETNSANSKRLSFLKRARAVDIPETGNESKEIENFQLFQGGASSELLKTASISNNRSPINKTLEVPNSVHLGFTKTLDMFEDNIQTDAFGMHLSSIKNSTFLPQKLLQQMPQQILEKSLHIKQEIVEDEEIPKFSDYLKKPSVITLNAKESQISLPYTEMEDLVINESKDDIAAGETQEDFEDVLGRSIYYNYSFKTPTVAKHIWNDVEDDDEYTDENFMHPKHDNLDQTNLLITENLLKADVNPFSLELIKVFLESIDFTNYLSSLPSCELRGKISMISKGNEIRIKDNVFVVTKIIGEGAYGTIYSAKSKLSGKLYALKQEKPANLWEYYICLELGSRIQNVNLLSGFMDVEYALIGNNGSILASEFSPYGSFLTVCNMYKRKTSKNLDEYIVMILTSQILTIIDHLHASQIIHADIKPDNFLLMKKLSYPASTKQLAVQLIDFGISIDMKLFAKNQTFMYKHTKEDFKCIEMRENRPWTYQTDLYGLAGTIHVLLYGKYMDVQKNLSGFWAPKQRIPRYLNKNLWEPIFQNLLNVRDCNIMPNLQNLRTMIEQTLADHEKYVNEKVNEFNFCLEK